MDGTKPMNELLTSGPGRRVGWVAIAAVGGILVGLVAGPVLAGALAPTPTYPSAPAANGDQPPEHTISVVGSGKVTVVPDQATIRLGVVLERKTAKAARRDAAEAMTRVVAAIRKLGIAEKDIATSAVSLNPVWDYSVSGTAPRIRGYQLNNIVTVTVRDLDVLGDVLDDGIVAGATSVEGITFDVADRTGAEKQAREAAVQDAKTKAETLASGVGVRITGVASMSESVSTPIWYDRSFAAPAAAEGSDATPVLPGTTDVTISVSVAFLIG
jgi:uncharacterized protein YggE